MVSPRIAIFKVRFAPWPTRGGVDNQRGQQISNPLKVLTLRWGEHDSRWLAKIFALKGKRLLPLTYSAHQIRVPGLGLETRSHCNFGVEQARDRAVLLRVLRSFVEGGFVSAGYPGFYIQMNGRNSKAGVGLFEYQGRFGVNGLCCHVRVAELTAQRHRESAGVRRSHQLFGIGTNTIFESRAE